MTPNNSDDLTDKTTIPSYINITSTNDNLNISGSTAFTIQGFVYLNDKQPNTFGGIHVVFEIGCAGDAHRYYLFYGDNTSTVNAQYYPNKFVIGGWNGSQVSIDNKYTLNQWFYIAMTKDTQNNFNLYINPVSTLGPITPIFNNTLESDIVPKDYPGNPWKFILGGEALLQPNFDPLSGAFSEFMLTKNQVLPITGIPTTSFGNLSNTTTTSASGTTTTSGSIGTTTTSGSIGTTTTSGSIGTTTTSGSIGTTTTSDSIGTTTTSGSTGTTTTSGSIGTTTTSDSIGTTTTSDSIGTTTTSGSTGTTTTGAAGTTTTGAAGTTTTNANDRTYKSPGLNLFQRDFDGTSNVYSPYIMYEGFSNSIYDNNKYTKY
jgi:hypothetical protein